ESDHEAEQQPAGSADDEAGEDLVERNGEMPVQLSFPHTVPERDRHRRRRRQHDLWNGQRAHREPPVEDEDDEGADGRRNPAGKTVQRFRIGIHASSVSAALKCLRMRATNRPNSLVFCIASVRGRGRSTKTPSTMRPGRGVITTTRSARYTASAMLCVTSRMV